MCRDVNSVNDLSQTGWCIAGMGCDAAEDNHKIHGALGTVCMDQPERAYEQLYFYLAKIVSKIIICLFTQSKIYLFLT